MQVRQRLKINAVVSVITAFIILLILSLALYSLNNANDSGKIAGEIITGAFERVALRNDYIWNGNERAKEQWFARHEEVGRLLKSAYEKFRKPEDIPTLARMLKNHEAIGKIFSGIVENREKAGSHAFSADLTREIENRLLSQLNMRGYEFVINGRQLLESSREARDSAIRRAGAGIVFVFLILVAATLINSSMMGRTIADRIRRLRDGALVIGGGNLDHQIDIRGDDEFSELSGTVNEMTAKLRKSQNLLNEMGRIATVGGWEFDMETLELQWTEEVYRIHEVELSYHPTVREAIDFYAPNSRAVIAQAVQRAIEFGESWDLELEIITAKGNHRWVQAIGKADRALKIVHGTFQDITERKRAEEEIKRRTVELEEANRELEGFSYSVSHDLRAPLRHMTGFAELLEKRSKSQLDDKSLHYISVISQAANKMGILIDDLLAFSRIGRTEVQMKTVSLTALVREVIQEMNREVEGRDIAWKIGELPDVYGDPSMLKLVLVNLISNAVKFTRPRTRAEIEIGCNREKEEAVFFVKDNGVGFDMSYGDKLFGVFQRLHTHEEFEGTGIGLANVLRIISRHCGRTWAEGAPGEGATFYFTLQKIKEA